MLAQISWLVNMRLVRLRKFWLSPGVPSASRVPCGLCFLPTLNRCSLHAFTALRELNVQFLSVPSSRARFFRSSFFVCSVASLERCAISTTRPYGHALYPSDTTRRNLLRLQHANLAIGKIDNADPISRTTNTDSSSPHIVSGGYFPIRHGDDSSPVDCGASALRLRRLEQPTKAANRMNATNLFTTSHVVSAPIIA